MNLAFGIPCYRRQVDVGHVEQSIKLGAAIPAGAIFRPLFVDSSNVDSARNDLVHRAMAYECDGIVMVDADTFHVNPADLFRMIESAREMGAAVAAAPVRLRNRPGFNAWKREGEKMVQLHAGDFSGRVVDIDQAGTAFMWIDLAWLREEWPDQPWFVSVHLPGERPVRMGSDVWFTRNVRERGGRVVLDGRFEPVHVDAKGSMDLQSAYATYLAGFGSAEWAVSFELARYLQAWIWEHPTSRACDLGSGFSSYVLRRFVNEVWSVDLSAAYLAKTAAFLGAMAAPLEHLHLWSEELPAEHFDLVVHDLGGDRGPTLERAWDLVATGGAMVLDDLQRHDYRHQVEAFAKERGLRLDLLERETRDRFGRYAGVLTAP